MKHTINLGGLPTILPSMDYRERFSNFMKRHFIGVCIQMNKKSMLTKEEAKKSIVDSQNDKDNKIGNQKKEEDSTTVIRPMNS
jgi:hypothetical protein